MTRTGWLATLLLAVQGTLVAYGAWIHSPTFDETAHLPAGLAYWTLGREDIYPHNPPLVRSVVAKAGLSLDDVEMFFFTQLNLRTIEATMAALGQPMIKTHWIMHKWGYTGSACIPMALDDAIEQGKLRYGDHIVFCASGGGLATAAAVFRWTI